VRSLFDIDACGRKESAFWSLQSVVACRYRPVIHQPLLSWRRCARASMASNLSLETNSVRKMSTKPNVPRKWGDVTFPTEGILPKQETGAAAFISANKDWDGRGIRVAIFDTVYKICA